MIPDSIDWSAIVDPVTFAPVFALRIRGFNTKIKVTRELVSDKKFNFNDFMLELLGKEDKISTEDAAIAIHKLKERLDQIPHT